MAGLAGAAEPLNPASTTDQAGLQVAFVRPDVEKYHMGWPGAMYDVAARTADYTKVLTEAATELGMKLDIDPKPLWDDATADAFLQRVNQSQPAGVILVFQHLDHNVQRLCSRLKQLAAIPTIVFSPMGTSFHNHLLAIKAVSDEQRLYFASTWDYRWLAFGVRVFQTIRQMRDTRICVVQGKEPKDVVLDTIGTTLRYVQFSRFSEEYGKVEETDEIRAMATAWEKNAQSVVEPTKKDIVDAAKTYVVCRRLMEQGGCQGIAVDCLPHVKGGKVPPPCMGFSHLNDEGAVASCQADWPAAISLRLAYLLLGRPGFMNNMCSSSVNNTLIGAHCTSPTRLAGPDQPPVPYRLRTHSESDLGVAPQVIWPVGETVTVVKFSDPQWFRMPDPSSAPARTLWLGSGRVVRNIDTPPSGGCRTSLEVELDAVDDIAKVRMLHHVLYVLGDHVEKLKAYCELAGLEAESLTG
jgi:hypothetical protein